MSDLDSRLQRGPLRVRSVWSHEPAAVIGRRILRRRRALFSIDAVALCACLALAVIALRRPPPDAMIAAVTTFADGSRAEPSTKDTRLRVEEDSPSRVVTRLTGGARFEVVPNKERRFEVQSRDVRVRVLGTIFSVAELPSAQTQVLVERGRVEVAWLGGSSVLEAGQGGVFPPTTPPVVETPPPPAPPVASPEVDDEEEPKGRAAARRIGPRDDVADLMNAADVARLTAHPDQAVQPLRDVCDRHAGDRRAPVAAFTLGRVLLDDLARPAEAAAAFRKARVLWPEGPLAEDALAREADAWQRAGRKDKARSIAQQYLTRHPQGRHAAAMRILAP
jgi:transmembrane sensor